MGRSYNSRKINVIRNTTYGIFAQIFTHLANFIYRTVFIHYLSVSYLGAQGLFSDILTFLSLAELGIGSAITFSMYKPLAENDTRMIKMLMKYYAKLYSFIGIFVLVVGAFITPFLKYIILEIPSEIPELHIIYLLFVINSAATYFFSYKRSIIIADQKSFINTINISLFAIIQYTIQIILVIITGNYLVVLSIQIICTFASNLSISRKVDKLYPYLKDKTHEIITPELKGEIQKKIRAMMLHKVGAVVIKGTDNILIAKFYGLATVGLYSNYLMIEKLIHVLMSQFSSAITASIGNLTVKDTVENSKKIFDTLFMLNFWFYGFCTICIATLINPFITIWLGEAYLLDNSVVVAVAMNFYILGMREITLSFRNALGLFYNDRYKPIFEAVINVVSSIVLLKEFGLVGVFLGTIVCRMTTTVWVEPVVLYHNYFKSGMARYFIKYFTMLGLTLVMISALSILTSLLFEGTILSFIKLALLHSTVIALIFFIIFFRTKEYSNIKHIIESILVRKRK